MSSANRQTAGRVGIYVEPSGGLGGAEYHGAVMAQDLSDGHDVDFVHHQPALRREELEAFTGLDLSKVALRYVPRRPAPTATSPLLWRLWRQNSRWNEELSRPYETFVNLTHGVPPFCHARHGVLMVLFPFFQRNWMRDDPPRGIDPRRRVRDAYYDFEWRRRMQSYTHITSNSEFTRRWTKAYWEVDTTIVYPPVDTESPSRLKQNIILSVGRFSTSGHPKKQGEIIRAFNDLPMLHEVGWRHHSVGGLSDQPDDRAHFARLQSLAGPSTSLLPNLARAEVKEQFAQAKLFVHAAGFGEPTDKPEAEEHFGIVTVEAMAAGAVPVVVNRGGQPELVEHGVSGFVWNTIDELRHYLVTLARDDAQREQMAAAARIRAEKFSRQNFLNQMKALLPSQFQ